MAENAELVTACLFGAKKGNLFREFPCSDASARGCTILSKLASMGDPHEGYRIKV